MNGEVEKKAKKWGISYNEYIRGKVGMKMVKLIAIDLDGTLLDKGKYISDKNIEAIKFATDNAHDYEIADNKRQHAYEEQLMATGRGTDIARVALRQETRSWVQKAEPIPVKVIEDYVD
jgi:FMN phosphatase YigB (HAD superfamily)